MDQPADLEAVRASYDRVADSYVDLAVGRQVLPGVAAAFARALVPGGQVLIGTHVGDRDITRRQA